MWSFLSSLIALTTMSMLQVVAVQQDAAGTFYSDVHGRRLAFVVSREDALSSPRWLETEDNPPLSGRAAIRAASELLPTLVPPGPTWRVRSVTLNPTWGPQIWLYLVKFYEEPMLPPRVDGLGGVAGSGPLPEITMVVLMNGRAIVPIADPH